MLVPFEDSPNVEHQPGSRPEQGVPPRQLRAHNQVAALQYVTVANAPTYRAIIEVVFAARHHYVIELRPAEIAQRIREAGLFVEIATEQDLEYHLGQLVTWGNLAAAHDVGSVSRLEDFYRKLLLYRLTPTGDAAHRAVLEVEATTGKSGSLQSNMLVRIRDALADMAATPFDDPKRFTVVLHDLHAAFETLTAEANPSRDRRRCDSGGGGRAGAGARTDRRERPPRPARQYAVRGGTLP